MGNQADDILTTLRIDETKSSYDEMKAALNQYFGSHRNILVERARFNRRIQREGEPIDSFIQDLYRLAEECNYSNLKEELIRDRIIVGVTDECLSDRLQSKADLDLNKAIEMCRLHETQKQNRDVVRGNINNIDSSVEFVKKSKPSTPNKQTELPRGGPLGGKKCQYCGRGSHERRFCPAKNAVCHKCKKRGHYKDVCQSDGSNFKGNVDELEEASIPFLGEVSPTSADYWKAEIEVNGHPTTFKLDTGAGVSVLSEKEPWLQSQPIKKTDQILRGPGGTHLPIIGVLEANLKYGSKEVKESAYVIANQPYSLLSRNACVGLGLVVRASEDVEEVNPGPDYRAEFPKLFKGLGKMNSEYHITLKANTNPVCLYTPRKVPHPLLPKVKQELEKMAEQGVISPVTEPTEWCSGMVPVPKPNGSVRICVDLVALNRNVQREVHPMFSVDESLAKLGKSKVFSKLDANSGFWQLPLDKESRLLTTFITPYGRYCFNRVPFGICSAPEVFQRTMSEILQGLDGVICHIDDTLVHGKNQEEHDIRLRAVLKRLEEEGVTLNEKCEFSKHSIKFLGHIIDEHGIRPDPTKTEAIRNFPVPEKVNDLQRFLGMVNQMGKFIPGLAAMNEPLRQLLKKDNLWYWGEAQQQSFDCIKDKLASPTSLAHYDPSRATIISSDASNVGIGAVLLQIQDDGTRQPVSYASRSLTETEKNYAVIEKEALAVTWACDKFSDYVLGMQFNVETDHKPLVPLLTSTDLSKMPPRILRFRMRLMRYSPQVTYVPGKNQTTADALSRAPSNNPTSSDSELVQEVESFASHIITGLPATPKRLQEIKDAQDADEECSLIKQYCSDGWPAYSPSSPQLRPYWENKQHFAVIDQLLLYDNRIVIPRTLRLEVLDSIHQGHLGITKCQGRARMSVWWPGMSSAITDLVTRCFTCAKLRPEPKEPLMPSSFPSRPWERLAIDLYDLNGKSHMIVVDYYSRWAEIKRLPSDSSETVVKLLKEIFATHGIPDLVVSDNGPQFACRVFKEFAINYGFTHITSSPMYPRGNGEVERSVRTVKEILKKSDDPYLGLLSYRTSPLQNGLAPCELLMSRQLRTQLPTLPENLKPQLKIKELVKLREREEIYRSNQKVNHDLKHKAKDLPQLHVGDKVWIRDQDRMGKVLAPSISPRSYVVQTDKGTQVRRNRSALVAAPAESQLPEEVSTEPDVPIRPTPPVTRSEGVKITRSGRTVRPPERLIENS